MDITELILNDHNQQRRMFSYLEDIEGSDTRALGAIWNRLRTALEVHAAAEEELFYPHLLKVGKGSGDESVDDEVVDVIKDHNEIRDAIRDAEGQSVGSDAWWEAVAKANKANSDHMAEEERDDLKDFRRHAPIHLRHDIAVAFASYEATNVTGVAVRDRDPQEYVEAHH